jgi:Arc/MetJ-type ribon-helix-helix transcriptional regulator
MSSNLSIQQPAPERAVKRSVSLAASLVEEVERRIGKKGFSAVIAEALEQWLAMAKLRELIAADRKEFGPIPEEAMRRAEAQWSASD